MEQKLNPFSQPSALILAACPVLLSKHRQLVYSKRLEMINGIEPV
jgi:hypothetical protein